MKSIAPRSAGALVVVTARAPRASMFDWVSRLRAITSGRGTAVVRLDGYDAAPEALARAVLGARAET